MEARNLPTGKFGCIVTDNPWSFSDTGSRATPGYPFMTADELRRLYDYLPEVAAEQCHLYMWTPDTHLGLALYLMDLAGFQYKHQLVWVKRQTVEVEDWISMPHGPARRAIKWARGKVRGPVQIGMGHYFRKAHEVCLFGTRGANCVRNHGLPSVFEAPRGKHSAKPECLQDMAELMSPGPYLELFARRQRAGWTCWGNEL